MSRQTGSLKAAAAALLLSLAVFCGLSLAACRESYDPTPLQPESELELDDAVQEPPELVVQIDEGSNGIMVARDIMSVIQQAGPGDVVTITGANSEVYLTISLNIPAGVTVRWQASCSSAELINLLELSGSGSFELAAGGSLSCLGPCLVVMESATGLQLVIDGGSAESSRYFAIGVAAAGCSVQVDSGQVRATGDDGIYAITAANSDVTINGGKVSAAGPGNTAVLMQGAAFNMNGGEVTSDGTEGKAVFVLDGVVNINGGKISAAQDSSTAVVVGYGSVTVRGGSMSTAGDDSVTLYCYTSQCRVSGGLLKASGVGSDALVLSDLSSAVVTAGQIESVGEGGWAILVINGAAACLEGLVKGEQQVSGELDAILLEVDSLFIAASRDQGAEGLTVLAAASESGGEIGYAWDLSGLAPVIKVEFAVADGDALTLELVWSD